MTTLMICAFCNTPMDVDFLGDGMHLYCGDPVNLWAAVPAEALGPCAVCGTTTVRYGDHATSTLCPHCQTAKETT